MKEFLALSQHESHLSVTPTGRNECMTKICLLLFPRCYSVLSALSVEYYVLVAYVAVPEICTKDLTMSNPLVGVSFLLVGMTNQVRFTPVHAELVLEIPSHLHSDILVPYSTVQVQYISSTHGLGTIRTQPTH